MGGAVADSVLLVFEDIEPIGILAKGNLTKIDVIDFVSRKLA